MSNNSIHEACLKTSLLKYTYHDIAKRDVLAAFQVFKDLRPRLEPYVFNDGTKKDLVSLDGTIPVSYKGSRYNIPVCVWLLETHPYNAPIVYVKPTNSMQIKPGRHVDPNGKINLPYLRDWKFPSSDLLGLLEILAIEFGEEPPVFSKVSRPLPTGPGQQPPFPQGQETNWSPPYSSAQGPGHPPYPTGQGSYMPLPGPNMPYMQQPYPSQGGNFMPASGYPQFSGNYPAQGNYPSQVYPPYPTTQPSYQSNIGYPSAFMAPSSSTGYVTSGPNTGSTQSKPITGTSTVTEEHIKASLLSAVEDKLKRRLKETFAQAQAEMDTLYKTQNDLQMGREKLEKMIKDLELEKETIEKSTVMLQEKNSEMKEALDKMENQGELDIDESVVTTAPLYRQLLNSFAEEQAVEDTIYYLGEALRKDVIDLDVFLKQVRELSRRQFMLRAIIQKCRERARLPILA